MAVKHHHPVAVPPPPAAPSVLDDGPLYPGGESLPEYRWAFNMYIVVFLLTVCVGLLNYLGWYLKAWTG
jgi:hypothetical protein